MISYSQARLNLISAVRLARDALILAGYVQADALKRRDKREPGRKEKEAAEEQLIRVIGRIFGKQRRQVEGWLENTPLKKLPAMPDLDVDDDDEQSLIDILLNAVRGGVNLFGTGKPAINYTLTNAEAARWVRDYVFDLVKGINQTTVDILRNTIGAFIETPGMTIRDVMDRLPFDEERAQRVAVTEITRAYSRGETIAGDELQKEFPGIRIIDTWFTNNDELVCELCGPLNGKEVEHGENFYEPEDDYQDGQPPRHVGCRCDKESTTALAE